MEYLKLVTYVFKAVGVDSIPKTEKEAQDTIRTLSEQPRDSEVWIKIKENGGIRHRNIIRALIEDIRTDNT
jgi:hypothetical protein